MSCHYLFLLDRFLVLLSALLCSERAIAIACLREVTFAPLLERRVFALNSRMTLDILRVPLVLTLFAISA